jgi:hypothetical protein
MEAVLEARKAGKLRYIGFTGLQEPLRPPQDVGDGGQPSAPPRYGADAVERDGLRQLRIERVARAGEERYRRAGNEADGRPHHSGKQNRLPSRMPALCHELTNERGDYGLRLHSYPGPGGWRPHRVSGLLSPPRSKPSWRRPRKPRNSASMRITKRLIRSTAHTRIFSGWAERAQRPVGRRVVMTSRFVTSAAATS